MATQSNPETSVTRTSVTELKLDLRAQITTLVEAQRDQYNKVDSKLDKLMEGLTILATREEARDKSVEDLRVTVFGNRGLKDAMLKQGGRIDTLKEDIEELEDHMTERFDKLDAAMEARKKFFRNLLLALVTALGGGAGVTELIEFLK